MEFGWFGPRYLYPGGVEASNFTIFLAFGYFWSICHVMAPLFSVFACWQVIWGLEGWGWQLLCGLKPQPWQLKPQPWQLQPQPWQLASALTSGLSHDSCQISQAWVMLLFLRLYIRGAAAGVCSLSPSCLPFSLCPFLMPFSLCLISYALIPLPSCLMTYDLWLFLFMPLCLYLPLCLS